MYVRNVTQSLTQTKGTLRLYIYVFMVERRCTSLQASFFGKPSVTPKC